MGRLMDGCARLSSTVSEGSASAPRLSASCGPRSDAHLRQKHGVFIYRRCQYVDPVDPDPDPEVRKRGRARLCLPNGMMMLLRCVLVCVRKAKVQGTPH